MAGIPGMVQRAPMRPGKARQKMWQAMRVQRSFTVADIVATAEVSYTNARKYVRALARGGYIACESPRRSGRTGGHARWRLAIDRGPAAPRIGHEGIVDPNLEPAAAEPRVTIPRSEYQRALACVRACQGMVDPEREVAALRERAQ